jgi:hypothetical protein
VTREEPLPNPLRASFARLARKREGGQAVRVAQGGKSIGDGRMRFSARIFTLPLRGRVRKMPRLSALLPVHDIRANLAHRGVLIAGAAAAAHRADQLAAFDQGETAGVRDQAGLERGDIGMTGFIGVIE